MSEGRINSSAVHSAFDEAFTIYLAELRKKPKSKKLDFINSLRASIRENPAEGIERSIRKLQSKCEGQGVGTTVQNVLLPIVDAIKKYSSIVDVMVSANPMPAALIWGGFKVFIEYASSFLTLCELLQDELETLTNQIRRLVLYERLYATYPDVQRALGKSYVSILKFWYHATEWCRKRTIKKVLSAPVTKAKIAGDLGQLDNDADRLGKVSHDAELDLQHQARGRQDKEALEASKHRQRQDLWTQRDALHKRVQLQTMLKDWLGGTNEFNAKQYDHFRQKRNPGSCRWLLHHELFTSWWRGQLSPSVLWLHAQPGAGKSVLCSSAIELARESPSKMATAYLFLKFAHHVESLQLLRALGLQLLLQLFQRQQDDQDTPDFIREILHSDRDDFTHVKRIFNQLVEQLSPVYVFLDGLNEVEANIDDFIAFLTELAANEKLRLWVSSQYHSRIQRSLKGCRELAVTAADTQPDIEIYLSKAIPENVMEGDPEFISTFQNMVLRDTKGSFLWASNMIEALAAAISEDERKMLIFDRLPATMDQYYIGLLKRLTERDTSGWGLLRIVLSLVTFAKRPLRTFELREAIAILRRPLTDNLSNSALPYMSHVLGFCEPLIEVIDSAADPGDGQVQLSHSIVRDFLWKHSDIPEPAALNLSDSLNPLTYESYVSSRVIAESCLRYLSQRKYSHLLRKRTPSKFDVTSAYDITDHHLLHYAAEFLFVHYNDFEPTKQDQTQLDSFLRSLNFYTLIQVRSIYLIHSGRKTLSREEPPEVGNIFPTWFVESQTGKVLEINCHEYINEWSSLLRRGVSWGANGEIDRCFWGALGPSSFLSKARELERYTSFMFSNEPEANEIQNVQYFHAISSDGSQLILAALNNDWHSDTSNGKARLRLERWLLDGSSGPCVEQQHELQAPSQDLGSLYGTTLSHRFALPPETFSKQRSGAVAFSNNLRHMRIGGSIWYNHSSEISTLFEALIRDDGEANSYWEEISSRGSILAVARRRTPRQEREQMGSREIVNIEEEPPDDEPADDLFDISDASSQDGEMSEDEEKSLYSKGSSKSESLKESIVSFSDDEEHPSGSELSFASDSDPDSALDDDISFSDTEAGNMVRHTKAYEDGFESDPLEYHDGIHGYCNVCGKNTLVHYHCAICYDYDICESCFDEGEWCETSEHSLTKRYYWGQQDGEVVHFDDLALGQEIMVFNTESGNPQQLFYFSRKSEDLMLNSPPIIHPTEPLVVWLMSRSQLLFADFGSASSSIHRLPVLDPKMQRISARLKFSTCGRYLHIISFEAPASKRRRTDKPAPKASHARSGFQATVYLLTYRLSEDTQETAPTLIFSMRFGLSPLSQAQEAFATLPFTVTWLPTEAFITVSDSELKVYKVRLFPNTQGIKQALPRRRTFTLDPSDDDTNIALDDDNDADATKPSDNAYISIPTKTILLPESAKDRTVQFFPPTGESRPNATLIIGSRSGADPTPPIGVYLSEDDLGGWINMKAARRSEMESLTELVQRLGGKFEDLVPGEDLDLVRMKNQDGFLESAELKDTTFSVHFGQDLELTHGRTRVLLRRIDESDGQIMFKTATGAGTAVLQADKEDASAKLNWYNDLSSPIEVYENMDEP